MKNILLWVGAILAFAFISSLGKTLIGGYVGAGLGAGFGVLLAGFILTKRDGRSTKK